MLPVFWGVYMFAFLEGPCFPLVFLDGPTTGCVGEAWGEADPALLTFPLHLHAQKFAEFDF